MIKLFKRWIALCLSAILMSSLPLFSGFLVPRVLAAVPIVTTTNITVTSTGTGTGDTFKIGDMVTGQFDDTSNDSADQATSVTIDFSQFGGGILSASEIVPGNHIWQASYTIVAGAVDSLTADITVTAINPFGSPLAEDDEDHFVDNIAPPSSGSGVIAVVNNNAVDNSTVGIDDKVSFAVGTLDVSDGETWTVNLASPFNLTGESALATGNTSLPATENNLTGGKRFPVTGTDNVGNTTIITNGTNSRSVDTLRPFITSAATETTNSILVDFNETINSGSVSIGDFAISNPVRPVVTASRIANTRVRLQTTSAFLPSATPTITIVDDGGTGIYDANGNEVNIGSSIVASDGVKPQVGPDVEDLTFTEGKNDRGESLAVTFSEAIPTVGSTGDYTVIYDLDGDFSNTADQRNVAVNSVSNPDNNQIVDLAIADQSGELDYNGRFQVTVNTSNVQDAGGNGVDTYANVAQSDTVAIFDSYTPSLLIAGLDPSSGLYGVVSTITVYTTTDDGSSDQNLVTLSGVINGNPLSFTYDAGDNRYEASYVVAEGDSDATGLEALSIQLKDIAGNSSNIISTSGNSLSVDANTPPTPNVSDPVSAEIIDADSRAISGTAESDSVVTIYTDPNNDGDKSDGSVVGSGISGGAFAISVPLVQNADNNFLATSTDVAGNESTPSDVATITEDSIAPVVNVNFPDGGELFAAGDSVDITWTFATDAHLSAAPISIYYSDDNGGSYNLIASNEANDGTYSWTAPDINSGQVLIKITALDEAGNVGEDVSDAVFAIDNSLPTSQVDVFLQGQAYGPNTWDIAPTNGKISGTAADSPAGVASVSVTIVDPNGLYWNGAGWAGASASVAATGTTDWSYALDKSNLVANNGVYAIYSQATDFLGNVESTGTGSFVWDNQDPTASIINPNINTKWRQGNRNITWSASDSHFSTRPIGLEYEIDGGGWNPIVAATENDGSYTWSVPTGTNTNAAQVRLTATDSAGNATVTTSPLFTIDSTQPDVSVMAPASSLAKGSVTLSASADDPIPPTTPAGMNYVRFSYRLVGGSWTNLPQIYSAPYNYDWDTTSVADGSYEIRATAADLAGNSRTTMAPYTVITVDNTAPSVVLSDDHADSIVRDADTVNITATFTEADQIDEGTAPTITIGDAVTAVAMTKSSNLVWTYQWDVPAGHNHDEAVSISATDRVGNPNEATTGKTSYTVDNTAPVITIDPYSTTWTNQDITVTASTDEGTLNTTSHTFTTNGSFDFVATDAAGNVKTETVTINNIDKTAPTGSITSPASSALVRGSITIDANALDGIGSGVSKVAFYHNPPVPTYIGEDATAPYSITWDTTGVADGSHTIYVKVFDNAGNDSGFSINIPITVDNTAPVISVLGDNPFSLEVGSSYSDPGVTASDVHDGDLTSSILTGGSVNTGVLGPNTITYDVSDLAGNAATQAVRTVNVVDTEKPSKPVANPNGGDYASSQSVQLSSTDNYSSEANIEIYYTTNNTDPDNTATRYNSPITVVADTIIKAVAYDEAGNKSEILTAVYGIAPVITEETSSEVSATSVTITWTTDQPATSRVVYDTTSHPSTVGYVDSSNYGYAFSSVEDMDKVTSHSVTIIGLSAGTTYYFRTISTGSPETVSAENTFTTSSEPEQVTDNNVSESAVTGAKLTIKTVQAPITVAPAPSPKVSPTVSATSEPEVKGEETEQSKTTPWWYWLVLAILVVIAGTGGYYYSKKSKA